MQEGTFILKNVGRRKEPGRAYLETDAIAVRFRRRLRATGRKIGGLFTEVEDAGPDRRALDIQTPVDGRTAFYADGTRSGRRELVERLEVGDVDATVRRAQPADAERIAHTDARIAALLESLAIERQERAELVAAAFRRGRKFYAGEAQDAADAGEPITVGGKL